MIAEKLNTDLSLRAIMHGASLPWIASPLPGVDRRPLYRLGGEQARATSLVRYAPGSHFSSHLHSGGEEFLVLDGVFDDEHGRYPAGTYVRNPPGSRHTPGAHEGCVIFVRLRQFHSEDRAQVVVPLRAEADQLLFENAHERVGVRHIAPGSCLRLANSRGLEVLLLEGAAQGEGFHLDPLSWMRLPPGMPFDAMGGPQGARLWFKDAAHDLGF